MKTPSVELFILIKSLNKHEKRYFTVFSSTFSKGNQNYIQLFDAIDRQTSVYNENEILQSFQKDSGLIHHLPSIKSYLYKLILKALENYYRFSSAAVEINNLLNEAEVLFNRALYLQSYKVLQKAKNMALVNEQFEQLISILKWENRISEVGLGASKGIIDHHTLFKQEKRLLLHLENESTYRVLSNRMRNLFFSSGLVRNREKEIALEKIIKNPFLLNEKRATTFFSLQSYHYIHSFYYFMQGNGVKSLEYINLRLRLFEENLQMKKKYFEMYISVMSSLLNVLLEQERRPEYLKSLRKLKLTVASTRSEQILLFTLSATQELYVSIRDREFEKGEKTIRKIEPELLGYHGSIKRASEIIIFYYIAIIYLTLEKYKKSREWISRITDSENKDDRQDLQCVSRIINLLIYYEQNSDSGTIDSYIKSTYRYVFRKKNLYKFEELLLDFFRTKIYKVNNRNERVAAFKTLRQDLITVAKNPYEAKVFKYFDFVLWIDSKILGKSFSELARKKG
jgi:hypothetical protein